MTEVTQIGPDGFRYPLGEVPEGYTPPTTLNLVERLTTSDIQWHRQPSADMLDGVGFADDGDLLTGAGFIIPESWDYIAVDIMWAKFSTFDTPGDISLGARLTWYSDGQPFGTPYFGGRSTGGETIPQASYTANNVLHVTNVVLGEATAGALLTVDYGRVATLGATGSRATELEEADTASISAGQGGILAVVVYRPEQEGHTWRKANWEGHTWR